MAETEEERRMRATIRHHKATGPSSLDEEAFMAAWRGDGRGEVFWGGIEGFTFSTEAVLEAPVQIDWEIRGSSRTGHVLLGLPGCSGIPCSCPAVEDHYFEGCYLCYCGPGAECDDCECHAESEDDDA